MFLTQFFYIVIHVSKQHQKIFRFNNIDHSHVPNFKKKLISFYYIFKFTPLIIKNNIILLNMFPNNAITNHVSKQYKTLGSTFFNKFFYLL